MPKVKLSLPVDSTFLSSVIYEGLLFLISEYSKVFSLREIDLEDDSIAKAFAQLMDTRAEKIEIVTTGRNDKNFVEEIIGSASTHFDPKKKLKYSELLKSAKNKVSDRTLKTKVEINLEMNFFGNSVKIDLGKGIEGLTLPQIFKIDRYTGFSSLEMPYTSKKLKMQSSKEVALIALLGIYSSFVATRQQQQNQYYFLFFSADETLKLLASGSRELVKAYLKIKDEARRKLSEIIARHYSNELLIAEVALSVEIRDLLKNENLDKVSLLLFKISLEEQTYKIYEVVPLEFFSETKFDVVSRQFRDTDKLIEVLREAISPEGVVLNSLASMDWQNRYAEAENILSAVHGLYRFVVLGDSQGFFEFTQKLSEAVRKLENSEDGRERKRADLYRALLAKLH